MTLDQIKDRCRQCGDCWEWIGHAGSSGNHPQAKIDGKVRLVRRYAYELSGREIRPDRKLSCSCENKKCINPQHMLALTESQKGKRAAARGAFSNPARGKKIADGRRKTGKLTMEQAMEIRMSEESGPTLAARFGINRSLVGCIKRGERWKDYTNPFAGLGAR